MTNISQQQSGPWRALGEAELAASPEVKLGGALAIMFWCAVALVAVLVLVMAWLIAFGSLLTVAMMSNSIFAGSSMTAIVTRISLVPQVMLFVWGFTFAVMTMARKPSTPKVASTMIVIWAALSISAQIATRYVIAQNSFIFSSQATLLPYIVFEIALAAAFWGYMSDGRRPNVYFRKRVRA